MVGTGLALLTLTAALGGWVLALRWSRTWHDRLALQNAVHLATTRLAEDAYRAERVVSASDSTLVLLIGSGRRVSYRLTERSVLRNGRPVHAPDVEAVHFEVRLRTSFGAHTVENACGAPPAGLTVAVTLARAGRLMTGSSTIAFRHVAGRDGDAACDDPPPGPG